MCSRNLQPWHEGPDLYRLWEPCREKDSPVEPHARVALGCVEALAELHAKGWAHGDVQPAHFIIGPERTHLIDLALARGGHVPEGYDFTFRGCLVHYEAPEIARSVLTTGEAEPTQEADVCGLGASLLISATGWRAMEYPDDARRPVQREAVANGKRRPVKAPGPLGELIDAMLSHAGGGGSNERPSRVLPATTCRSQPRYFHSSRPRPRPGLGDGEEAVGRLGSFVPLRSVRLRSGTGRVAGSHLVGVGLVLVLGAVALLPGLAVCFGVAAR